MSYLGNWIHLDQVFLENVVVQRGSVMNPQPTFLCHSAAQEAFGRFPSSLTVLERNFSSCQGVDLPPSRPPLCKGLAMYPHGCASSPHGHIQSSVQIWLEVHPNSFSAFAQLYLALAMSQVQQDPKFSHAQL